MTEAERALGFRRADAIRRIKAKYPELTQFEIGERFGISQSDVGLILTGRRWVHRPKVKEAPPKPSGRPCRGVPKIEAPANLDERNALIRKMNAEGNYSCRDLAEMFGVGRTTIQRALNGIYGTEYIRRRMAERAASASASIHG